ncbi:MAG: type I-C CRISPR-associated endonuclease Cas1c [Planctomycetota bacterium]
MKQLQNNLYVTTQNAYLSKEGEAVVVKVEHEVRLRVPIHTIGGIVCFGQVSCSPWLMEMCSERGVAISFLTENGRFMARVQGPVSGNVLVRREQYRRADDITQSAVVAGAIVTAKIMNCRTVLQRAVRDHPDVAGAPELKSTERRLASVLGDLRPGTPLDTWRGIEGDAARSYFQVFDHLITAQKDDFYFHERSRRPPMDNMNCLLSFLYTLLAHDVSAALQSVGLDPAVGYLHRDRPGRPGLALDLMEEFRPFIADRLALSLVNLRQVQAKGFRKSEAGGVLMDDATRKEVLVTYQKRKQEEIVHPFLGDKTTVALLIHLQALLFSRYLRGDLDGYPPFVWK